MDDKESKVSKSILGIPKHKVREHEEIDAKVAEFYKKKKAVKKVEQGKIKPHSSTSFSVNNKAKLKLTERNKK